MKDFIITAGGMSLTAWACICAFIFWALNHKDQAATVGKAVDSLLKLLGVA